MLEEGYAAVSARRVAAEVGVNVALVHYYFTSMDGLFIALFQRGAEARLQEQSQVLASPQPLWGLWQLTHHQTTTALTLEFIALANHRKAVRAEIAKYLKKFRKMQLQTMGTVLQSYGIDPSTRSPASVIVSMWAISQYLLIEQAFDLDIGHADIVALIERHITSLEGPQQAKRHQFAGSEAPA
jgi:AcrR family transcriptional regulator